MQSFWDLLPASLWPTQRFIPPNEQARIMQALWAQQASANAFSPVAGGSGSLAGPSSSQAPAPGRSASGGDDTSAPGGILGAVFGASAATPTATSFQTPITPPQQAPSFVPVASTADQLAPYSPPAAVPGAPGLTHAQHPIDTMQPGWATGAQSYFPRQNFVQHMISGTPERGPLWDDATRKSLVDYAVSRGIVPPFSSTAGSVTRSAADEITREPPAGAALAPWSAAHGLLDVPVVAPLAGLTEFALRQADANARANEARGKTYEQYVQQHGTGPMLWSIWSSKAYQDQYRAKHGTPPPLPEPWAPPGSGQDLVGAVGNMLVSPAVAFKETWDRPLHPPPNSTFDDGGTIYVDDANGESRPWSEVDPKAAQAYYEQERRRADFAPSFALNMLGGGASFAEPGAVGVAGSRLGGGTRRPTKRSIETAAPGALADKTATPLVQADAATSPILAQPTLTGQNHHAISKRVCTALDKSLGLAGFYKYRDPRFATRAIDRDAHNGYQTWHRNLDNEIATYVRENSQMTPEEFERYLRNRYAQPDLLARFPNGL